MAHFAKLNEKNIVIQVLVINNQELIDDSGIESENKGIEFCKSLFGGKWIQTSYNGSFRKNYAGVGFYYDAELDAFIPPQPYPSWILNTETAQWESPVPFPNDMSADAVPKMYIWNEDLKSWVLIEQN